MILAYDRIGSKALYLREARETLAIAALCGVRHPVDPGQRRLLGGTTDLLLTLRTAYGTETVAYAVKQAEAPADERTL